MGIPSLAITANTTLGAKIVLSAAYFEASSAELIGAEGLKLQILIAALSEGNIQLTALTTVNKDIRLTLGALSTLESQILKKITTGKTLHEGW